MRSGAYNPAVTTMALAAGSRLGAYEIVGLIGAGGMGEVYRARDSRLDRQVAIKSLPDGLAADPERAARFEREAKLLATLNHPNIATIHGLEAVTGEQFIVMELVEGETLAERIERGPIPLDEALPVAKQIAEALEAAHEQGVIHRDLKPANIKLRPDGGVKVLDFGLAKALTSDTSGPSSVSLMNSPTITSPAVLSGVGVVLGTAAYMSPEQAKGRPADKRSDIWAFGCVLYEMLTGRRAFAGEDVSDTIAAVLRGEPDWTALPATLPSATRSLIQGCLKKDRLRRISAAGAVLYVLNEPRDLAPPGVPTPAPRARWKYAAAIGAAAIGATVVTAAVMRRPAESPHVPVRFPISLPEGQQFTGPARHYVDISPDGTRIAYFANSSIYLREISDLEPRVIPGSENLGNITNVSFSPEGTAIAFAAADSTLKRIAVRGGAPVTICAVSGTPFGVTWTRDGILFGDPIAGIMRVPLNGSKPEVVVPRPSDSIGVAYPSMLPDGSILFSRSGDGTNAVVVHIARTGELKTLIEKGVDARFIATGHLVYADSGTIFAVPFDSRRLAVTGGAAPVIEGVRRGAGGEAGPAQFAVSNAGSLVYVPGPTTAANGQVALSIADRKGVVEPLKLQLGSYTSPRVSPDGNWLAFESVERRATSIWIYNLSGTSTARPFTFGGNNRYPVWAADSRRIYFQSDRDGDRGLFSQSIDGGAADKLTHPEAGVEHVPNSASLTDDVLLVDVKRGNDVSLWTLSLRDRILSAFGDVRGLSIPTQSVFSPNGRWVAYQAGDFSANVTFVEPMPPNGSKYRIGNGGRSLWSRDGTELFIVQRPGEFAVVGIKTQPSFTSSDPIRIPRTFGVASPTDLRPFDTTRDGRFVVAGPPGGASVNVGAPQINVVLNWFEELQRLVPAGR